MADDEGFQIPEDWDVIVVGTDLTNSLVAAACAYAGQKVLHLDANSFYGQAQSSLSLSAFHQLMNEPAIEEVVTATEEATHEATDNTRVISILNHRKAPQPTMSHKSTWSLPVPASGLPSDLSSDPSSTNPSSTDPSSTEPSSTEPSSTEPSSSEPSSSNPSPSSSSVPPSSASAHEKAKELLRTIAAHQQGNTDRATEAFDRRFNIDLVSQPLFGASPFIDLLIRTKSASYIDFRGIDQTLMLLDNGSLATVPSSKGEVFNSKVLGLKEKRQLMKFMQVCRSPDEQNTEPTESFESFLASQQLTPQLQSFVSNAIVMDRTATSPVKLTRSEAVQRLQLYLSSIGRFPNMSTPFIFPSYGASELPQAFCRLSAVVGTVYVLRNAPSKLLFNPEENRLTGAVLNNGQTLKANRFVFSSSSIRAPSSVSVPIIAPQQIARCVCITNRSLLDGVDNLLVTVPPAENALPAPVLALQLGTSMVVTPQNYWIVTFSSALASLEQLQSAVDRLLTRDPSDVTKPLVLYQGSYLLHQTDNDAVASLDIAPSNLIVIPDAGLIDGPEMYEVSVANAQAILEALNVDFFPEERPDSSQQPDEPEAVEPTQDSEAAEPAETSEAAATSEAAPGDSAVQTAEETVPTQTAE